MRLLLIEDDRMIGDSLVRGLGDDGHHVDWVRDGDAAAAALTDPSAEFALVLLDWGLPGRDGLSLLRALRARASRVPVLMITARDRVEDRVEGLDAGADDYLVKPFELSELKARIRSLLRRHEGRPSAEIVHGALVLDPVQHEVRLRGEPSKGIIGRMGIFYVGVLELVRTARTAAAQSACCEARPRGRRSEGARFRSGAVTPT